VKRALVIGAAATLAWVAVANSLPGKQPQAADWSQPKTIGTPGITATYPRGWHATKLAGSFSRDLVFRLTAHGFEGWNVIFVDHDVAVQAFVGLGPGAQKWDAERLLDGLTISRAATSPAWI
jgi:hypothetical protein